jgi:signal transduction histidine kinase
VIGPPLHTILDRRRVAGPQVGGDRPQLDRSAAAGPDLGVAGGLIQDFPAAVTIAELEGDRVVADSDLATRLLGCTLPRIGERLSRRWTARRDFEAFIARFRSSGRIDGLEVRLQRNDGAQFWCSVSARQIQVEEQPFILLHMLDLTDQIAARAEISRQRDALHDAEKLSALGQLLGGISHELNNPLSVLTGQALMLKEKAVDEATVKRADRILSAAERCTRIVRSFLDLARGEPADPVPVDLNEIVVEAIEATIDGLRGEGIEPLLELPKGLPSVVGDPDQIRQVVINLIVNARQAMSGGPGPQRISIRTRIDAQTERLVLKVSDTGPGVPAEISSRIFDPLFTTKAPDKGTGLGLALCRRIMDAHGGSIDLEGTSARGSTFVLTFLRLEHSGASGPMVRRERSDQKGLSILILDDRPEAGAAIADLLSDLGHGLELVQSAFVGARLLRRQRYDVILCRAGLGDLSVASGLRAVDEARPGAAASSIFILDAHADNATLNALDQLERPYLQEPFDRRDLSDVLELLALRPAA